jgi:hypothetical protein
MPVTRGGCFREIHEDRSSWEPRVVVRLRSGGRLVGRDLRREADFVHRVRAGLAAH